MIKIFCVKAGTKSGENLDKQNDDTTSKNEAQTQIETPAYSRLAGYEDVNDAERLAQDPTFRLIGSEKVWDRGAALTV
jgi:hypothetical protein